MTQENLSAEEAAFGTSPDDPVFAAEQAHLSEVYAELDKMRGELARKMEATSAAIRELRMTARRPNPDSSFAARNTSTAPSRVVSRPRVACRGSMNSLSDMIALDQWMAPTPRENRASAMPRPMKRLL